MKRQYPMYRCLRAYTLILTLLAATAITVSENTTQAKLSKVGKTVGSAFLVAPGGVDTTFSGDGIVTTSFGTGSDYAHSVAIQSDGKVVAAGSSQGNPGGIALARYNADGSLDTSFDGDGKITTHIGGSSSEAQSVAIQSDGKIVVAGSSVNGSFNYDLPLVRYNTDGSLDASFSGDGIATTPIGSRDDEAYSVAIQSINGVERIVAAGFSDDGSGPDFALVRYNNDGSLDASFDGDGKVTTAIGTHGEHARSVAIQSDGKIVAAGVSTDASLTNIFALVRYNTNGSLDTSFDGDGKVTTPLAANGGGYSVAFQSINGVQKIVAAGSDRDQAFALVRYNTNGSLDSSFDGDGIVITDFGSSNDGAYSVAIQSVNGEDKIVAAGYSLVSGYNADFALARYNTDGTLNVSFDGDGKVTTPIGTSADLPQSIAIQPDGKIVAAGNSEFPISYDFALARYNMDGSLDGHGILQFGSDSYSGAENAASIAVNVTRYGTGGAVSAAYSLGDGTATGGESCSAGVDYINTGGTVSFANGDSSPETINLTLCNDAVYETNEYFVVTLSNPTGGATLGTPSSAYITIISGNPVLQFGSSSYSGAETAASIAVTVTRSGSSVGAFSATYSFSGGATGGPSCSAGVDYINTGGTVSFADGDTATKTINIPICDDTSADEGNEYINATLSNPIGAALGSPSSAIVTIIDDDTSLQFNSDTYNGVENSGSISVGVWRAGRRAGTVSAAFSFTDGTATGGASCAAGVDYINTGGTVSFADNGNTYMGINVPLCNDSVYEGNESSSDEAFNISLSNPTGGSTVGTPNPANVTIIEDDPTSSVTLTVTQIGDAGDGVCDASCTLRDAITAANYRHPSDDTITFSATSFSTEQTVTLTSGQLYLADGVVINGPGANLFSVSCNNTSRAFYVSLGVTARLDGMTIRDGYEGIGGGILNGGTLTVSNSIVRGNSAVVWGGGIHNVGTLIVSSSTVSGNTALGYYDEDGNYLDGNGGGIFNYSGTAIIANTTISENSADYGGGILNNSGGTLIAINSTVSGNTSHANHGGGLFSGSKIDNETLTNSIVAGNTGGDIDGIIETASHNLIGNAASSGGIVNGVNGNIVGVNALLGALRNNGGPTLTHALLAGSLGLNAGNNCVLTANGCGDGNPALPTDQRGMPRNGAVDIGAFERQNIEIPSTTLFDFDGDGRSDVSVFRPSDRVWYLNSSTDGFAALQFGLSTDKIVPADYDGDGKTDIAVFRDGTWWWINSHTSTVELAQFGLAGDIPVPADYTGDGRDELAVYRNGQWRSFDLTNGNPAVTNFGIATDRPVPADYDGDGKTDVAIFRDGTWWRINSGTASVEVTQFGLAADRPVAGDYDGDSKADLGVYRDGTWYLLQSRDGFSAFPFGIASDIPTPADYDGDGKTDVAVYRNGTWYVLKSTGGISIQQFGLADDKPIPAAYVR